MISQLLSSLILASSPQITLNVDASQAPLHIVHTQETMKVTPGPFSVNFAQWIPGQHQPTGKIDALADLHFYVHGKEIPWRRDLVDLYQFHLNIPANAHHLYIKFDFLAPSSDEFLCVVNWYNFALFPSQGDLHQVIAKTTLKLPTGWKEAGSLDVASKDEDENEISFKPVSISWLFDHPVLTGKYLLKHPITAKNSNWGEHAIDIVADSPSDLKVSPELAKDLRHLVQQERTVFGNVGHYRKYHWLLTLSNRMGSFGVEHHECSDDRIFESALTSPFGVHGFLAILLPHEFFHSWNGKFRRPAGLVNDGFTKPMKDDGLWVYEGLTDYYGEVMAVRSGFWTEQNFMQNMFRSYTSVLGPGRLWKPLQDTADFEPYTGGPGLVGGQGGNYWRAERRGDDYYPEGDLLWLAVDVKIMQLTDGKKNLDDFLPLFAGGREGKNGVVAMKPYHMSELFADLNKVVHYDWKGYLETRLQRKTPQPPISGIINGGYKIVNSDGGKAAGGFNAPLIYSLGISVGQDGKIFNEWIDSPAYKAGIGPAMSIVTVDGKTFTYALLKDAVVRAEKSPDPIVLTLRENNVMTTATIDYHGGLQIPHFVKDKSGPDLIKEILAPR